MKASHAWMMGNIQITASLPRELGLASLRRSKTQAQVLGKQDRATVEGGFTFCPGE